MKDILKEFVKHIIPYILKILIPIFFAILIFLSRISETQWWIILSLLCVVIIILMIYLRIQHISKMHYSGISSSGISLMWNRKDKKNKSYLELNWQIEVFHNRSINKWMLNIVLPPLCPNCGVEIEQKKSFWVGWIWFCCNCNFKKRNRNMFEIEAYRVERIMKPEIYKEYGNIVIK